MEERRPALAGIEIVDRPEAMSDAEAERYSATALLRAGGGADGAAVKRLFNALKENKSPDGEPYYDLVMGLIKKKAFSAAESILAELWLQRQDPLSLEWLSLVTGAQGDQDKAIKLGEKSLEMNPYRPELYHNLGHLAMFKEQWPDAIDYLDKALTLRDNMTVTWYLLAKVYQQTEELGSSRKGRE